MPKKDKPHDGKEVLVAGEVRIGTQVVRARPEMSLDFPDVFQRCFSLAQVFEFNVERAMSAGWLVIQGPRRSLCAFTSLILTSLAPLDLVQGDTASSYSNAVFLMNPIVSFPVASPALNVQFGNVHIYTSLKYFIACQSVNGAS